jgi:hypothetical protein
MLFFLLFLPLKLLWFAVRLLLKIVFLPVKAVAVGLMLQIAMLLAFVAVLAVIAYFVYQLVV